MPLYLDTTVAFGEAKDERNIVGGQFGLASKEFTPAMAKAVFDKWDLDFAIVGETIAEDRFLIMLDGEVKADLPLSKLSSTAPEYDRPWVETPAAEPLADVPQVDPIDALKILLESPNYAAKNWVYEQYDSMVGTVNMSTNEPADAGIVNLKGTNKALAMTVDCNARMVNADPEEGCAMAVAEAARNIVCSGGIPSAITNCLNFGNPYNPEVYWQFVGAIKGMTKSCKKFNTPVTGGNVSFYNQSTVEDTEVPVFPTPTIGMLGIVEDKKHITSLAFKGKSDLIYLIGKSENDIAQIMKQQVPLGRFGLPQETAKAITF